MCCCKHHSVSAFDQRLLIFHFSRFTGYCPERVYLYRFFLRSSMNEQFNVSMIPRCWYLCYYPLLYQMTADAVSCTGKWIRQRPILPSCSRSLTVYSQSFTKWIAVSIVLDQLLVASPFLYAMRPFSSGCAGCALSGAWRIKMCSVVKVQKERPCGRGWIQVSRTHSFLKVSLSLQQGDQLLCIIHDDRKENNELLVQNQHDPGLVWRHQFASPGAVSQLA